MIANGILCPLKMLRRAISILSNCRYHRLESAISGSGREDDSSEKHPRDNNQGQPASERLTKLEQLSKTYAARTCFELKSMGVTITGRYFLDPDGSASGLGPKDPPVEVYCDMSTGEDSKGFLRTTVFPL